MTASCRVPDEFFRVEIEHRCETVYLAAIGELDLASSDKLAAALDGLHRVGVEHIVLDLRRLEFLDCSGLRLILASDTHARRVGHQFSLIPGPRGVQRLFEITGIKPRLRFLHPSAEHGSP